MLDELDVVAKAIYAARGAHEPVRAWRKWEDLDDAARGIWRGCANDALVAADSVPARRYRHKKRGSVYLLLAQGGRVQTSRPIVEGDLLTSYRGADGTVWHRLDEEFNDGRFEPVTEP